MLSHPRFPQGLADGFTAYIPRQLTTCDLRVVAAPLEEVGFPRKIRYAGHRRGITAPRLRPFVAEYRPRFETFIHAGACRKLTYISSCAAAFHVDVLQNSQNGEWSLYKFNAGRLLSYISAQGYGEALIRASAVGLDGEEPALTFCGDAEECRRENQAQREIIGRAEDVHARGTEARAPISTLVFGVAPSVAGGMNLIFVERQKALELAAIHEASRAQTWGEFKLRMPPEPLRQVLAEFRKRPWASFDSFYGEHVKTGTGEERESLWLKYERLGPGERMPFDEDSFPACSFAGAAHRDWPEHPEREMLSLLPPSVQREWGRRASGPWGECILLDPLRAPEIISALENAGFTCCWNEELVQRACGLRRKLSY